MDFPAVRFILMVFFGDHVAMLRLLATVLPLYLIIRLIVPLRRPLWLKLVLAAILIVCSAKYPLFEFFYGTFTPPLPRWAMIATGISHGTVVFLTVLCLLRDLFALGWLLARHWRPGLPACRLSAGRWLIGLSLIAVLLATVATWQGLRVPEVRHIRLEVPHLPRALDGLRIVQLSDLHISTSFQRDWVASIVKTTNALKPDLICITGDLADGQPDELAEDLSPLRSLHAPLGVFSCLGNHEYYWGYARWAQASRDLGLHLLENSHMVLDVKGQAVVMAGVTDPAAQRFGLPLPDIGKALTGAPPDALRILLAHRPALFPRSVNAGVDIQLSGHTHGGQVAGLDLVVAAFNDGFRAGVYQLGAHLLYVSSGCALWPGFPLRLLVPSEITELTLRAPR